MKQYRPLRVWLLLLPFMAAIFLAGYDVEDLRFKRINDALSKYTYLFPQQKVYLHIDKRVYRGDDDIWVKAYLLNALDHVPDTISTNLYVELISPAQTRVEIKRFQMIKGFGKGDFHLSDTLPEGLYQIRAYTAWMKNFDPEFYFEKNFQLMNPQYSRLISPKQARTNKRKLEKRYTSEDFDLQFMPESGYLINGIESVVGFKAINKAGRGVEVSGTVVDNKGHEVAQFKTQYKGMGRFSITPQKGQNYFAVVKHKNKDIRVPLPKPMESGLVIHTENFPDKILVRLTSNRHYSDPAANDVIVVGQVGGRIYYSKTTRLEQGIAEMEIRRNVFPSGIMQITAFSSRGVPLAERLVFVNLLGTMRIHFTAADSTGDKGKKVVVSIYVTDQQNKPLKSNVSLSVTREATGESEINRDNIISSMLIVSDLKGFIEDPMDYFSLPFDEKDVAIDNLMLTQGWRRFEWTDVLAGEYPKIKYKEEKGITITGRITRDFFNRPLENCKVQLSIMDKYNDVFTQQSKRNGTFEFDNLVYYDTVSVKIEAWRPSGRKNLVIQLPSDDLDKVKDQQGDYMLTTYSDRDKKEHRLRMYEENKKLAQREKDAMEERKKNSIQGLYGDPDYVLYAEDFHMVNGNILDVMKGRVPGVQITGNNVLIRGVNTITGSTQPLFLVDGAPVMDVNSVTAIPIQDIERVEVLKGPKTSLYGARGANGVIAVYTKRGQFMIRGKIEFDMLGYSTPRQFYQPKYEPNLEPEGNYTIAWFPELVTDSSGKVKAVFDQPSVPGNYRFNIQGVSYFGHVGYTESVIESLD